MKVQLDDGAYMISKAHEADAGYDLKATKDYRIAHFDDGCIIDTGVHVEIPVGCVGYIQGRSGLNINHNIVCPTGVVDSGYTGSIKVKLYNLGTDAYHVHKGDRIAQLVIQPIATYKLSRVNHLEDTDRGADGFGSSGR